jgi:thiamine pyrophosphokinase
MVFLMPRAVIFINGQIPEYKQVKPLIQPDDTFFAVDGGSRHALKLGLKLSAVIGDLDSISASDYENLEIGKTEFRIYPRDKNETDFELALINTLDAGFKEILVVGALGNRLDQTIGNLALLSSPFLSGYDIQFDDGVEQAFFVRSQTYINGIPGDTVSLIPWGGEAIGIVTDGLRWPLHGETLIPYQTRGISNELISRQASVSIQSGLLLVIRKRQRII